MVKKKSYIPQKGDIVWLDFSSQAGHEQKGRRPALVISSTHYNKHGLMLACPITSQIKGYPFEIFVSLKNLEGVILADHIKNLDWKARNADYLGKAPKEKIEQTIQIIAALLLQ